MPRSKAGPKSRTRSARLFRLASVGQPESPTRRLLDDWRRSLACVEDDLGRIRAAAAANLPQATRKGLRLWALRARRDLQRAEVVMAVALELFGGVEACLRSAQAEHRSCEARPKARASRPT